MLAQGDGVSTSSWSIGAYQSRIFFRNQQSGLQIVTSNTGADYTDDTWHHLVITRNGTYNMSMYLDGVLQTEQSHNITNWNSSTNFYIGSGDATNEFTGQLDEIKIMKNYTWTPADVLYDYNSIFNLSGVTLNSEGYNSSVYETDNAYFYVNITTTGLATPTAVLVYNNTRYTGTNAGDNTNAWFYATVDVPIIASSTPKNFYWEITYNGGQNNTPTKSQTINPIYLYPCNGTYTVSYINYTFKDETDGSWINASISPLTVQYYLGNGGTYESLTYTNTTQQMSFALCFSPSYQTLKNNGFSIRYYATNYYTRTAYFSNSLTNTTTNITLYLLKTANGNKVSFQILNTAEQTLSDVLVNISNSLVGLVGSGLTDSAGSISFFVDPYTSHTVQASKTGYTYYTTTITPTESEYTITMAGGTSVNTTIYDYGRGISWTFTPVSQYLLNGTDYLFNFSLTSTYWDLDSWGFNISSNQTYIGGTSSTDSTGGSIGLTRNTGSNKTFKIAMYWIVDGNRTVIYKYYTVWDDGDTSWSFFNFITDLESYISDGGIFGLEKGFSLNILIFLVIFITTGILSYKFGLYSPIAVSFVVFLLTALFDVVLGLVSNFGDKQGLTTFIVFMVFVAIAWKGGTE